MPKLLLKLGLLGVIALAIATFELWLPIDQFTFRVWEALHVKERSRTLKLPPGPFYPRQTIHRKEVGDLMPYSSQQVVKDVTWVVDDRGFRTGPDECKEYPIVVIGDSIAVGTSLDQKDILSNQLARETGQCVYAMTGVDPRDAGSLLFHYGMHPKVVVYAFMERYTPRVAALEKELISPRGGVAFYAPATPFWVLVDRLTISPMMQFRTRRGVFETVKRAFQSPEASLVTSSDPVMHFFEGKRKPLDFTDVQLEQFTAAMATTQKQAAQDGVRFIHMPVPDKESIYPDRVPMEIPTPMLPRLYADLKKRGVEYVDLYEPFREAYLKRGELLYHLDDSHWNREGVELAAKRIKRELDRPWAAAKILDRR